MKFRVFDKLDNKTFQNLGFEDRFKLDMDGNLIHPKGFVCDGNYVIQWMLGKDSNDKEIYAGDKVKLEGYGEGVVKYENGEWVVDGRPNFYDCVYSEYGILSCEKV